MAFSVKTKKNESLKLEDKYFASGGEGVIHKIVSPDKYKNYCVKIYKDCISRKNDKSIKERDLKIDYMVKNPPSKLSSNHWLLTWPIDVVYEQNGNFLGFIMPLAFDKSIELFELTNIKTNSKLSTEWNKFDRSSGEGVKRRLMLNANIAIAVHHLHATNKYVIVDMKPQNFLVSPEGKISVLDIDTIQISENGKVLFPSKAMTPEYLPPEINNMGSSVNILVEWDRFILSLIFYEVLFGLHPYACNGFKPPYSNSNTIRDNISNGLFPFGQKSQYFNNIPKPHLNFKNVPLKVQNLFINSFEVDLSNIHKRPSAELWGQTFYEIIKQGESISPQNNGISTEKQREIDWINCNKTSIQSLQDFVRKYKNNGMYVSKALQLIKEIQTKNNLVPQLNNLNTNQTPSISELKKSVNQSLIYSILSAIFLNILFGIIAVVYSSVAKGRFNRNNFSKCEKPLKVAKVFRWISFGIAVINIAFILIASI